MKIIDENRKVQCDMGHCRTLSTYIIEVDENRRHDIHICKDCFNELYSLMAKIKTPKGAINVVKRAENRRNEWNKKNKY